MTLQDKRILLIISGGIAPNVIPPHAEAEVMFRTVGPTAGLQAEREAAKQQPAAPEPRPWLASANRSASFPARHL